jgi:hypothetical protein
LGRRIVILAAERGGYRSHGLELGFVPRVDPKGIYISGQHFRPIRQNALSA